MKVKLTYPDGRVLEIETADGEELDLASLLPPSTPITVYPPVFVPPWPVQPYQPTPPWATFTVTSEVAS